MVTEILVREISQNEVEISLGKEIFFLTYSERLDTTVVTNVFGDFIGEIQYMQYNPNQSANDYPNNIILGKLYDWIQCI